MKNLLLNNELIKLIKRSRFIKIAGAVATVLVFSFIVQAYAVFTAEDTTETASATITVNVAEMYFEQADSELPKGQLQAEVGDTIEFHNKGTLRHSVTIDAYDFDEVINPGETTTLTVDRTVDDVTVNCRFHTGHDAVITVTEGDNSTNNANTPASVSETDTSNLPVRSYEDSIERLEPTEVNGVKEFQLTAEHIMWEYANGEILESWGYAGQLPGPEIRVTEGDRIRVVFENKLPVATTVHWHGVDVPNEADGVPGVTQDPIEPGETFIYEFTAKPAGTKIYHSHGSHHGDENIQMDMGLAGPLIIEPPDYQAPDKEFTMVLTERQEAGIYPINGRIYPDPDIYHVSEGDRVRFRIINAGSSSVHPMHLHGHQFEVIAMDGNPVPEAAVQLRNNQPLTPGETYDIAFDANNPGRWLFHCHHLGHSAGGMITELVYE